MERIDQKRSVYAEELMAYVLVAYLTDRGQLKFQSFALCYLKCHRLRGYHDSLCLLFGCNIEAITLTFKSFRRSIEISRLVIFFF
jgi:hypothetical protein